MDFSDQPLTAVSRTISRLLKDGVVLETPMGDSKGPRRKRALSLNPRLGHCLSIHYGPESMDGVAMDTAYGQIVRKQGSIALKNLSRDEKIRAIISFVRELRSAVAASAGPCLALAVVDPGMIDETSGSVLMSTLMDDWTDVPIVEILEQEFQAPILLMNTSMATVRAVDRLELKSAYGNLIFIEYQSGIACGLKLQGNYITGRSHLAGEFGHLKVTDRPVPCRCGAIGCLEAVAALPALAKRVRDTISQIRPSGGLGTDTLDGLAVFQSAARGDRLSRRVVDDAFSYLGVAAGGLINLLAPEILVFDHQISFAGPQAVSDLMQSVRKSLLPAHAQRVELRVSQTPSHLGSLGGAVALLDTMIEY